MYSFHSIRELLNALVLGRDLLGEMFSKRKSFDYRYEQAVELVDEQKLLSLIEKGILIRNGSFLEIEDQLLSFFEQIMDVNEEINTSYIHEHITQLKENIDYFLTENNEARKFKYLKSIKASLRKIGFICLRNIVDLYRNIDNAFKTEPNYKIKIKKLENYDQRRLDIKILIGISEKLITEDELTFFALANDDELNRITTELRLNLLESRHNLIEMERQIIDYLNQVKHQTKFIAKLRQVKYLKDQFELESKSDLVLVLERQNLVLFEPRPQFSLKLSLDGLQDEAVFELLKGLTAKQKGLIPAKQRLAAAIDLSFFQDTQETEIFINLEEMRNGFMASGRNLMDFVLQYNYPKPVCFEEMLTCFCQLISLYEADFRFTEQYAVYEDTEFSVVFPK
ncbi:MAG: hypothetical protein RIS47_356 [Bacteroidota bacterium]|jgi:hypothetical protein